MSTWRGGAANSMIMVSATPTSDPNSPPMKPHTIRTLLLRTWPGSVNCESPDHVVDVSHDCSAVIEVTKILKAGDYFVDLLIVGIVDIEWLPRLAQPPSIGRPIIREGAGEHE